MRNEKLQELIENFINTKPSTIDVIGYGSAVKNQKNNNFKKQIDVIATVEDPTKWHLENYNLNRLEYNFMAKYLIKNLMHFGTDIEYISNILYDNNLFKIGIINRYDFIDDLINWSNFYMAGRMQKPIMLIKEDKELEIALRKNRLNALKVALLLSYNKKIYEEDLYKIICSLSYIGDIRMYFGMENPHKIDNIVYGEFKDFKEIYREVNEDLFIISDNQVISNKNKILRELNDMPRELVKYLIKNEINIDSLDDREIDKLNHYILKFIKTINLKTSISEPIKSAAINNFDSSIEYIKSKRKKYIMNRY